ncbi:MAG: hypothetical protein ABW169_11585 [Sphingobium sp.]
MTMVDRFLTLTATVSFLLLPLGGCTTSAPVVRSSGIVPSEGSYGFGEGGALPTAAASLLTERLAQKGLTPSDSPRYLVQTEYSRPPARTGTLVADRADPAWQRAPLKSSGQVSRLSLSVTEIATGTEVYRTSAWQKMRGKADDSAMLMQAALTPPAPPPTAPAR